MCPLYIYSDTASNNISIQTLIVSIQDQVLFILKKEFFLIVNLAALDKDKDDNEDREVFDLNVEGESSDSNTGSGSEQIWENSVLLSG